MTQKVYVFPTSFAQQRLWFLDQFEPDSASYNIPAAIRLTGALNKKALNDSLCAIIDRHEILRTTFTVSEGSPVQVVSQERPIGFEIAHRDLSGLAPAEREAAALRQATLDVQRPFDLAKGPLLRVTLSKLDEQDHILSLTMHHIICDGWSMGVFIKEMAALYEAFSKDLPSPLAALPLQYADYAHWQRRWLQGETLDRQLDYWKKQLGGGLPVLELPTDRQRPPVQSFRGAERFFTLPKALTDSLKLLSKEEGATLFMTLVAAFNVLLYRYTNQEDLLVGTPVANRDQEEIEGLIGCFVNTLVLRTDMSGNPTFGELLGRVREVCLGAYAHQDIPFEKLVEELQPTRDLSRPVLFQAMISLHKAVMPELRLPDLTISRLQIPRGITPFDLLLLLEDSDSGMTGLIQYSADLFEAAMIDRMLACFQVLLEGVVTARDQRIFELPMLTQAERHQLLFGWNDTDTPYAEDECIHQMFEAQAERTPDAVALVCGEQQLTYRELNARANQLARYLQALGVGPDVLVGICMERSLALIVSMLATLKAGGAYVPLDPQYPRERLAFMLEDARALVLLTKQDLVGILGEQPALIVPVDLMWGAIATERAANLLTEVVPSNLVYAIYTSGSTGRPKGTMIQHRSLVSYTKTVIVGYGVESADRVLQFCSISFDISAEEIYPCLTSGATLVLRNDEMIESVLTFLETCQRWKVTMLSLPTAYWHEIVAGVDSGLAVLPDCLRLIIIAGERALPERLKAWGRHAGQATRLINTYGLTESTIISTLGEVTAPPPGAPAKEVSIGKTIRNTQIYVLDKHMRPVPIGVPGEVYIGGLLLARGYLGQPDATAERFGPDPFGAAGGRLYSTGDAARYLPDGDLEFLGRIDQQVKIRGFRVELGEIEAQLRAHPAVQEAIAVAQESSPGNKRLVAYLVAGQGAPPTVNELRSFLQERLPHFMIPSAFLTLDALPLTPNGKVDRRALPEADWLRPDLEVAYASPSSDLERMIAGIWQEVLRIDRVGVHDNFFDLGGHSLLLIELKSRLVQRLDSDVSMVELFKYPTISSLAQYFSHGRSEGELVAATPEEADSRKKAKKQRRRQRLMAAGETMGGS